MRSRVHNKSQGLWTLDLRILIWAGADVESCTNRKNDGHNGIADGILRPKRICGGVDEATVPTAAAPADAAVAAAPLSLPSSMAAPFIAVVVVVAVVVIVVVVIAVVVVVAVAVIPTAVVAAVMATTT